MNINDDDNYTTTIMGDYTILFD